MTASVREHLADTALQLLSLSDALTDLYVVPEAFVERSEDDPVYDVVYVLKEHVAAVGKSLDALSAVLYKD
jgi:hypothetical protein